MLTRMLLFIQVRKARDAVCQPSATAGGGDRGRRRGCCQREPRHISRRCRRRRRPVPPQVRQHRLTRPASVRHLLLLLQGLNASMPLHRLCHTSTLLLLTDDLTSVSRSRMCGIQILV